LSEAGIDDLPSIGAKAAQLAELGRVVSPYEACPGAITVPVDGMAIPLVHGIEHFAASGAAVRLGRAAGRCALRGRPAVAGRGVG
jgi:hypothetical protein